jgi:16S rRNA (cytosine967-C5)-methyltransferase
MHQADMISKRSAAMTPDNSPMHCATRTARDHAITILLQLDRSHDHAAVLLDDLLQRETLSPPDAALLREIVMGVLRHRITLDHLAARFFRGEYHRLKPRLRCILRAAIYQLCWLERIPDFAAVDEAVTQAKRADGRKAGGLVNAVLRALLRARGDRTQRPANADERRWLPIREDAGFLFPEPLWPDPQNAPADFLAQTTSHPLWLVRRWLHRYDLDGCRRICEAGTRRPPLVVRANRTRITPEALHARLTQRGLTARLDADSGAVLIDDAASPLSWPEFHEGLLQPQDATAQNVWRLRPPLPGELVLDLCAGVGTKATHAAELMDDRGLVFAADIDEDKLRRLETNAARLGLKCIRCVAAEALPETLSELGRPPELILIDAPCSNTGVLARRCEARYRLKPEALPRLAQTQIELLHRAAALSGPQTQILYSTCSIEPEENENVISEFCRQRGGWRLVTSRVTLPTLGDVTAIWQDGGFVALLRPSA